MKTTLDLPEDLLNEVMVLTARRRIPLNACVETALRRGIRPAAALENPDPEKFEVGPFGILRRKRLPGEETTMEQIKAIQDELEEQGLPGATLPARDDWTSGRQVAHRAGRCRA